MNLEREIKINKILLIFLITLSVGTIVIRSSYAMFSKKETFNNVLRIITASELPSKGTEDLIEKAGTSAEEIQGIDPVAGTLCSSNCKEYRYTGSNVNNYVKLTNLNPNDVTKTQEELWRIIGVFQDEDNGEWFLRIVRDEILPESYYPTNYIANGTTYTIGLETGSGVYWNKGGNNYSDWTQAGLQFYLNGEQDSSGNKGYMSYLSDNTKNMLRETKHYLGISKVNYTNTAYNDTTILSYQHERNINNVYSGFASIWPGKISLMYPSDIGFAADKQYWSNTKLYNYNSTAETSWLKNAYTTWLITPSSFAQTAATEGSLDGSVIFGIVNDSRIGVRPVLNIKSDVKIKKGTDGSKTNPYELKI